MPETVTSQLSLRLSIAIGVVGGFFSGLLGIGGGTVMVPLLVLVGRLTQRTAHAVSLGAMILIATGAIVVYGGAGEVDLVAAAALATGAIVGARVGVGFLARASEVALKTAFGVFLILAATLLAIK